MYNVSSPRSTTAAVRYTRLLRLISFLGALIACVVLAAPATAREKTVVDVDVQGLSDDLEKNVLAFLGIAQQKSDPTLTEARIRRLHKRAPKEIVRALQPYGYYEGKVESALTQDGGHWLARYVVDPGQPIRISVLDVKVTGPGAQDAELQRLATDFPLKEGDVLVHNQYERGKDTLQRAAAERGYLDAQLTAHEVQVTLAQHAATITLALETGARYRFGPVTFLQKKMDRKLLQRYVPFKRGAPYQAGGLLELQSGLIDSDYFQAVEIQPRRDIAQDFEVPIDVNTTLRPKFRYTAGLGYGTDTGTRGSLGWENRRVNAQGHRFKSEIKLAEIYDRVIASYIIPIRDPRSNQVAFTASWDDNHPSNGSSEKLSLGVSRTITRRSLWLETLYLNYDTESFRLGDEHGNSKLLIPGISWSRVIADNRIYTRHGGRLLLDVHGTHTGLGSTTQFGQIHLQGKLVQSLWGSARILLRGEVGATRVAEFTELPTSQRFFTGGDQSVRGYDYNALGPKQESSGKVVGGEQLLVGSVELEQRLAEKWSAAVFYDRGNAMTSWEESLKAGAGVGIRWRSPIGQIRVDVAWAVSEHGTPERLHINIGPDL